MLESATNQTEHMDVKTQSLKPGSISEKDVIVKEAISKPLEAVEEHNGGPQPHLHAKTFLAVFAVFTIYAAQLFAIVGAGTVSKFQPSPCPTSPVIDNYFCTARCDYCRPFWTFWRCGVGSRTDHNNDHSSWSDCIASF
jgi:hypothetical protein